jgi:hypothetical protein
VSKPDNYRQCKLMRIITGAPTHFSEEVSWIPTKFAHRGKAITIDGKTGTWTVVEVYAPVMTGEQLAALRGEQRDIADVLEPSA